MTFNELAHAVIKYQIVDRSTWLTIIDLLNKDECVDVQCEPSKRFTNHGKAFTVVFSDFSIFLIFILGVLLDLIDW